MPMQATQNDTAAGDGTIGGRRPTVGRCEHRVTSLDGAIRPSGPQFVLSETVDLSAQLMLSSSGPSIEAAA